MFAFVHPVASYYSFILHLGVFKLPLFSGMTPFFLPPFHPSVIQVKVNIFLVSPVSILTENMVWRNISGSAAIKKDFAPSGFEQIIAAFAAGVSGRQIIE